MAELAEVQRIPAVAEMTGKRGCTRVGYTTEVDSRYRSAAQQGD